ncbi:murein transglycosylase [Thioclava sp. SK-1]|uniref:lytic murein transglycosylase n=1 Tax=Thioclava sp. SK-1 TaxID=1889770 RepID=UPI000826290F|nr:lytic murein transglycosylase [Thioclava sp. SK-1]OCX66159.1 murein transglycosylase [Thioclava sp. SK-1]
MKRAVRLLSISFLAFTGLSACAGPLETSPRPMARGAAPVADAVPDVDSATQARFNAWVSGFKSRALANGITEATWRRAMTGVHYNPKVIERDRYQSEFTKSIWDYLDGAVSESRITNGRAMLAKNRRVLERIEAKYGVPKEIVVAVWGMETNYGTTRGSMGVISSLSTLAYDGRRGEFFAKQLIAALKIIQSGDVDAAHMTGSWAGAMGHTQFIPTSYLTYAVDFTGDGRRDIWSNDPTDALASTAAYLARSGWTKGQPWGVEVTLPSGFNYNLSGKGTTRTPAQWAAMGVKAAGGGRVGNYGAASILLPAGAKGPAFMIFGNFKAISRYNNADSYVLGVGHLADRIGGAGPFINDWPRTGKPLSEKQKVELQERLTARGFDTDGTDGKIGANTTKAIVAYQKSAGLPADGYATLELLQTLR